MSRSRALTLGLAAALLVVAAPGVAYPCEPAPCAEITPKTLLDGVAPFTVTLDCSASQLVGALSWCTWDFGEGTPNKVAPAGQVTHEYQVAGGYTAVLTVTEGAVDYQATVFVRAGTLEGDYPPVIDSASADPASGTASLAVAFDGAVSGQVQAYWRLGVGQPLPGPQANSTYDSPGSYVARLEAVSGSGLYSLSQPIVITVTDGAGAPPAVRATAQTTDASPQPPVGPSPLLIDLYGTPEGLASYAWDLGDGRTSTEQHPRVSYELPGTYWANVVGTDSAGRKGYDEVRIIVTEGDWPAAVVSVPPTRACVKVPYTYEAAARGTPTVEFELTTAPAGMTVDAAGKVTWTPTVAQVGAQAVGLQAKNGAGVDLQQFSVEVSCCTAGVCPDEKEPSGCAVARPGAGAGGLVLLVLGGALLRARRRR